MPENYIDLGRKAESVAALKIALLKALRERTQPPLYAALDGALCDDLQIILRGSGLFHRSLYLGGDTSEIVAAGPWLIVCRNFVEVERLLELVGEKALPVFWEMNVGQEAEQFDAQAMIYRHLRTLNQIVIPQKQDAESSTEESAQTEIGVGSNERLVIFRHYEPNALSLIAVVLDEPQVSRLLGPAKAIYAATFDMDDIQLVARLPNAPEAPSGFLRLRREQIENIEAERLKISRRRIGLFLKGELAFFNASDDYIRRTIIYSEPSAKELGIVTETGRARWAYVNALSGGEAARKQDIRDSIRLSRDPDARIKTLIDEAAQYLRANGLPEPVRA